MRSAWASFQQNTHLVLHREKKRFPWGKVILGLAVLLIILALLGWVMVERYHFHLVQHWPLLTK
jgi:hypothetical protein